MITVFIFRIFIDSILVLSIFIDQCDDYNNIHWSGYINILSIDCCIDFQNGHWSVQRVNMYIDCTFLHKFWSFDCRLSNSKRPHQQNNDQEIFDLDLLMKISVPGYCQRLVCQLLSGKNYFKEFLRTRRAILNLCKL